MKYCVKTWNSQEVGFFNPSFPYLGSLEFSDSVSMQRMQTQANPSFEMFNRIRKEIGAAQEMHSNWWTEC